MKKIKKIVSLALTILLAMSISLNAMAKDNSGKYSGYDKSGKYSEYDKNDNFSVEYNKLVSKAKDVNELKKIIESIGFVEEKVVKTVTYYNVIDGNYVKSNKKKIIENGIERFYIDDKEVNLGEFNIATPSQINSADVTMTMRQYRGTQIDQYDPSVISKLNLIYEFSFNDFAKPFTDLYGAMWDDTTVYATNINASSGLIYKSTQINSRLFTVPYNVLSGYINVMLTSRDGYIYDDHGNAVSEYSHATVQNPEWDGGFGVGFTLFGILSFSVSRTVNSVITSSVADFTY